MRNVTRTLVVALFAAALAACSGGGEDPDANAGTAAGTGRDEAAIDPAAPAPDTVDDEVAIITVEGMGEIVVELLAGKAPKTVENFKKLAREGFYDGTTFHRVIPGFMIQGGDPNSKDRDPRNDGRGGPGYRIEAEFNDTRHRRGVVSMARGSAPDTAGSQFFIVVEDTPQLDGQYTAFGRVVAGMDVADQVVAVPRDEYGRHGPPDRPLDDVAMTIRLEPAQPGSAEADDEADPDAPT